jgi:hypothetical protein
LEIIGEKQKEVFEFELPLSSELQPTKQKINYKKILKDCGICESIEFSLGIGCPVQCSRYCPQEVLIERYGNKERLMSFDVFKQILSKIPIDVQLNFAGFCEPFVNPDFVRMAEYAFNFGYKLQVFTTLFGAKRSDVERLLDLEFTSFCLHLRDGHVAKFSPSQEYKDNVFRILEGIPNVQLSLMNELFKSNNRENTTRGILPTPKTVGYCNKLKTPSFVLLPDGSVQLCCMDFGLKHAVGNLITEDYARIKKRFLSSKITPSLCAYCTQSISPRRNLYNNVMLKAKRIGRKVLG